MDQPKTNKYLIQTRSQTKSGGIKVLEVHGTNKGLNPHVKPGKQKPLPTLPMYSLPPMLLVQHVDKGLPMHPIPKPRIGQGRARLKRKSKTKQPIPYCYVWQCYRCVNLKGCLGVRCHKCKCIGAP